VAMRVVVIGVEALLEFLGLCRERLLGGRPGTIPGNVGLRVPGSFMSWTWRSTMSRSLDVGANAYNKSSRICPLSRRLGLRVLATRL